MKKSREIGTKKRRNKRMKESRKIEKKQSSFVATLLLDVAMRQKHTSSPFAQWSFSPISICVSTATDLRSERIGKRQ